MSRFNHVGHCVRDLDRAQRFYEGVVGFPFPMLFSGFADVCEWFDDAAGRFRIGKGQFGSVEETDGIALALGDTGPAYPGGLFVAQDGENPPHAQNFKLLPWATIKAAVEKE